MAEPFTPRFVDLVRNTTHTTGTGNFALGPAVSGFASFASAVNAGDRFYYCAINNDKPAEREVGRGTMMADGTVAREPMSGPPISFSSGNKMVALVTAAEWFEDVQTGLAEASSAAASTASTRTALAALQPQPGEGCLLKEVRREGLFMFDGADLSDKVAADPAQALYVAPAADTTGASGAWVRAFSGPVDPRWWGLSEGAGKGAENSAAVAAMFATLRSRAVNVSTNAQGVEPVRIPPGTFELSQTIDISDGTLLFEGSGGGGISSGFGATRLLFPPGVTGIRVQRYNTSGASATDVPTHRGGDGTIIRNLTLVGGYSGTEAEAHGIQLRARAVIDGVFIDNFEGDGIHAWATSGGGVSEGNANNSKVVNSRIQRCRNGIYLDGADTNVWSLIGVDCSGNRKWGFSDSGFLGSSYLGCHADANGLVVGTPPTVVTYNGNRYTVAVGQETDAAVNPPSGTTADNAWWLYNGAGIASPSNNIAEWASGTTYRSGGGFHTDNVNARHVFTGCYLEPGQGKAQLTHPSLVFGGKLSASVTGTAVVLSADGPTLQSAGGFVARTYLGTDTFKTVIGERSAALKTAFRIEDSAAAPNSWRLKVEGSNIRFDYSNNNVVFHITGPNTTDQLGTGVAQTDVFLAPKLAIGPGLSNARLITNGTAAPASGAHAQGEIVLHRTASASAPLLYRCTAAGSPGSWQTVYGLVGGDKGDVTVSADAQSWTIDDNAVTLAKMQDASAPSVLLGRGSGAGGGDFQEISLGAGLSMTGTVLSAATSGSNWSEVTLAADFVAPNSTIFTDITDGTSSFSYTPAPNGSFEIEACLLIETATATNLPRLGVRIDAQGTGAYGSVQIDQTGAALTSRVTADGTFAALAKDVQVAAGGLPTANEPYMAYVTVRGRSGSNPAPIRLQLACETAAANTCRVRAGSQMRTKAS